MKRQQILLFTLFTFITSSYAQDTERVITPQYLFPTFTDAVVFLKSKLEIQTKLNFNTLTEEMLFKSDTTILKLDMPGEIDSVIINKRVFIQVENMLYEYIYGTNIKLLKRNKCRWETKGDAVGYGNSKLAKTKFLNNLVLNGQILKTERNFEIDFYDNSTIQIYKENKVADATKLSNYIQIFPESKAKIVEFTKSQKLNLKINTDIIRLIDFINQLN